MTPASEIDIAYFSMEIAVDPAWPTYAGGLGVLAGDMLRSAADMGLAIAGVTLLPRRGYFRQRLDEFGRQTEEAENWEPETVLERLDPAISVKLNGRDVKIRAWLHSIIGISGCQVPVYFLDAECGPP
jgi:glycogen phosphorylase